MITSFNIAILPGCISDNESEDENTITTIDPNHPFAGEWTAQLGLEMYFFEYENSCSAEWNVDTDTATHIIDCTDSTGIKTTAEQLFFCWKCTIHARNTIHDRV